MNREIGMSHIEKLDDKKKKEFGKHPYKLADWVAPIIPEDRKIPNPFTRRDYVSELYDKQYSRILYLSKKAYQNIFGIIT